MLARLVKRWGIKRNVRSILKSEGSIRAKWNAVDCVEGVQRHDIGR